MTPPPPTVPASVLYLSLDKGKKYQLRYKYQAANYRWVERYAVVVYVDRLSSDSSMGEKGELFFSGRPEFGNFTIDLRNILAVKAVNISAKCYADRKNPRA